jgi:hypothetical protein
MTGKKSNSDPRTPATEPHITNRRLLNFAFGLHTLEEWEQTHIHTCQVCQSVLYVFIHQPIAPVPRHPEKPDAA